MAIKANQQKSELQSIQQEIFYTLFFFATFANYLSFSIFLLIHSIQLQESMFCAHCGNLMAKRSV